MKRISRSVLVLGLCVVCRWATADYAWLPEYQKLNLRLGSDFYSTDQNYNATAALAPLTATGAKLKDFRLWLEGEYGIAEDWSVRLKAGYLNSSLDDSTSGQTLAAGSGLSDITAGVKWNFKSDYPLLTIDVFTVIPAYSNQALASTQLALGDGIFNLGIILHTGSKVGPFVVAVSPGILARFGGYASLATGELALQLNFPKGYVRLYSRGVYPFQNIQPLDPDETKHTAPGSGGSYALLNGSPEGISAGGLIGVAPIRFCRIEAYVERSVWGEEYPYYTSFGFNLSYTFDFFTPHKKARVREVPFEGEQPNGFPD